jgi:hypothetical protein
MPALAGAKFGFWPDNLRAFDAHDRNLFAHLTGVVKNWPDRNLLAADHAVLVWGCVLYLYAAAILYGRAA